MNKFNKGRSIKNSPTYEISKIINDGVDYYNESAYKKAVRCYKQALTLLDKLKGTETKHKVGTTHLKIGEAYLSQEMYKKTIKHCELSLEIGRELGDENLEIESLENLADSYEAMSDDDKSLQYKHKILDKRIRY